MWMGTEKTSLFWEEQIVTCMCLNGKPEKTATQNKPPPAQMPVLMLRDQPLANQVQQQRQPQFVADSLSWPNGTSVRKLDASPSRIAWFLPTRELIKAAQSLLCFLWPSREEPMWRLMPTKEAGPMGICRGIVARRKHKATKIVGSDSQTEGNYITSQEGGVLLKSGPEYSQGRLSSQIGPKKKISVSHEKISENEDNFITDVVGHLSSEGHSSIDCGLVGVCALDGSFKLHNIRNSSPLEREEIWAMQFPHQLFSVARLDVNQDGRDEVIACAWDGMTYISDIQGNVVNFQLGSDVSAFAAGFYGLNSISKNIPCVIYVTFQSEIVIYYNIIIESMLPKSLFPDYFPLVAPFLQDIIENIPPQVDSDIRQKITLLHQCVCKGELTLEQKHVVSKIIQYHVQKIP
eukprot:Sdes_comp20617_c0_seq1m15685